MPFLPILAFFLGDQRLLSAAKADDLKEKYPDLAAEIDKLAESDPTPTKKYLQWSVGQLRSGLHVGVNDVIDMVKRYHEVFPRLEGRDKDISSFKTLDDMEAAVLKAEKKKTKGDIKKKSRKGGVVLYEDDRWMLVHPVTMDGAIYYGTNTSWCVSRRDKQHNYFYSYVAEKNVQFYFLIDKSAESYTEETATNDHHFSKVAMLFQNGDKYDAEPFQDAANRQPNRWQVAKAIGPKFDELYEIAREHAKKHKTTWAYEIKNASPEKALELYEENLEEAKNVSSISRIAFEAICKTKNKKYFPLMDVFLKKAEIEKSQSSLFNSIKTALLNAELRLTGQVPDRTGTKLELPEELVQKVIDFGVDSSLDTELAASSLTLSGDKLSKVFNKIKNSKDRNNLYFLLSANPAVFDDSRMVEAMLDMYDGSIIENVLTNAGCSVEEFKRILSKDIYYANTDVDTLAHTLVDIKNKSSNVDGGYIQERSLVRYSAQKISALAKAKLDALLELLKNASRDRSYDKVKRIVDNSNKEEQVNLTVSPLLGFFAEEALVSAAKADDLKEKYPELADEIDQLADADPTPQKKYLQWSVGQVQSGASVDEVIEAVKQYDKALPRLTGKDKDIGSLKTVADMQAVVDKATKVETKGDVKKKARKGGVILHEDDRWMLVRPDTQEASIYYGSNTAWCVSRRDLKENYWYTYSANNNVRFYFLIDKQAKPRGENDSARNFHFSKLAMMITRGRHYAEEPYQDAANNRPAPKQIEEAIGPVFNQMRDLAIKDANKLPLDTWGHTLFSQNVSADEFISIYEEHEQEIKSEGFKPSMKYFYKSLINCAADGNEKVDNMLIALCEDLSYNLDESGDGDDLSIKIIDNVSSKLAPKVLSIFSKCKSNYIRNVVAKDQRLSTETQEAMLNDPSVGVVSTLLKNPVVLKNPSMKRLAFSKATDENTDGLIWSGLMLNEDLPATEFEDLLFVRNNIPRKYFLDVAYKLLQAMELPSTIYHLQDDDKDPEVQVTLSNLNYKVATTIEAMDVVPFNLAKQVASGKSSSAIIEIFSQISKSSPVGTSRWKPVQKEYWAGFERVKLLEEMVKNRLVTPLKVQRGILQLAPEELVDFELEDTIPLIEIIAKYCSSELINDVIAKAVDLFIDEVIEVNSSVHKPKTSYKHIMNALLKNPEITGANSAFLSSYIEQNKKYLEPEDLNPDSDFMKASAPVLHLLDEDSFISDLVDFIKYETTSGGRSLDEVLGTVRTIKPFSKHPELVDRVVKNYAQRSARSARTSSGSWLR